MGEYEGQGVLPLFKCICRLQISRNLWIMCTEQWNTFYAHEMMPQQGRNSNPNVRRETKKKHKPSSGRSWVPDNGNGKRSKPYRRRRRRRHHPLQ